MAFIDWSNTLSVNIKEIDEQHKKLVGMVNELHEAMKQRKGKDVLDKILSGLIDYTKTHFGTEEKLMRSHVYPDFSAHKRAHDALTKDVLDLDRKLKKGESVLTIDVMNFLADWLKNHIQGVDKKYSAFLNEKGVK